MYTESKLTKKHETELHEHRQNYVNKNAKYKVGDFVGNVTGIIKVENIKYNMFFDNLEIIYEGLRYKKYKGKLLRTKNNSYTIFKEDLIYKILN